MKALVKKYPQKGLWFEDVPEPLVGDNDVKIKIHKTAICGTDLHIYNWDEWSQNTIQTPRVIGHEYVGEIVEVGANVRTWQVGEIVSGEGHIVCGKCRNCLAGNGHLCKETIGVGVNRDGAFAQYLVIPQENVRRCEKDIPQEMYAIFDPFGNAVHTALSFNLTGEDVLVTGAGPIGIMAAAVCKYVGARRVVITDIHDHRLELAKKLGIQYTVNTAKEDLREVMDRLSIREGFDVGLEMSGSEIALNTMIDSMCTAVKSHYWDYSSATVTWIGRRSFLTVWSSKAFMVVRCTRRGIKCLRCCRAGWISLRLSRTVWISAISKRDLKR